MQRKSTTTTVAPRRRRTRREIVRQESADAEAYAAFDASHRQRLVAYCMVYLRNWADAEEVAGDALFDLSRAWSRLRSHDERVLRAYVFKTARRKMLHAAPKRRRQKQQNVPLGWGTDDMDDDPALVDPASRDNSAAAVDQRMARLLHAALGTLEPDKREAVLRRYGDRHTLAEVAGELGTTEKAAGTLVRRALRDLRRHLIGTPTT
jgi:RNA polymerase sigma factor (sigma-70 family)